MNTCPTIPVPLGKSILTNLSGYIKEMKLYLTGMVEVGSTTIAEIIDEFDALTKFTNK